MKYLEWIKREVHFEQMAQEATLLDYFHELEHEAARIARLDSAITEAVKSAPPQMRAVIEALQALRGIAHVSAVTGGRTGRVFAVRQGKAVDATAVALSKRSL